MKELEKNDRFTRASGILLHVTSLPGPHGIGDLGDDAFAFVDFLVGSGQTLWQVLPLVQPGMGEAPYTALSSFAGNPLLISLVKLVEEGLLDQSDLSDVPDFPRNRVDFASVRAYKYRQLRLAYQRFDEGRRGDFGAELARFSEENSAWLDDYALFMALKHAHHGAPWQEWEEELVLHQEPALRRARADFAYEVCFWSFLQFVFAKQWFSLKGYANERGVRLIGDIPIFVAHDSADVWSHQDLFALDRAGEPIMVAGVPPDYFSATGQRWGNPQYRWDVLAASGYGWWVDRMRQTLTQVDIVRIDHFRGFESYWEIPADQPTAVKGRWVKGPGEDVFRAFEDELGKNLPIIVEDLGLITKEVIALRDKLGFPAMKVLQFAFSGEPDNLHLPHNFERNFVVYTATHDNDTTVGWWNGLPDKYKQIVGEYMGLYITEINWSLIRLAESTVAKTCIIPLQDVLGLGSEARMNHPGLSEGNWAWRYAAEQLTKWHQDRLRGLTETYGRLPAEPKTEEPET